MTARGLEAARDLFAALGLGHVSLTSEPVAVLAAALAQARREALEEAAMACEGVAGGHYMAQCCAAAIRALAHDGVETAAYDPLAVQAREIVAVCNQCGPRVAFDEDECCVTCGGQVCEAYQDGDRYVFNWPRASDGGEGE